MQKFARILPFLLMAESLPALAAVTATYQIQRNPESGSSTYTIVVNNEDGTDDLNGVVVTGVYNGNDPVFGIYKIFGLSNGSSVGVTDSAEASADWFFMLPVQLPSKAPPPGFVDALYYYSNTTNSDLKKGDKKTFYFNVAPYKKSQEQGLSLTLISTGGKLDNIQAKFMKSPDE